VILASDGNLYGTTGNFNSEPVPMPEIVGPAGSMSLTVVADYGQIDIYDSARLDRERRRQFFADGERDVFGDGLQDALADGIKSRRFVGTSRGLIDLMTPGQYNFKTPMLFEVRRTNRETTGKGGIMKWIWTLTFQVACSCSKDLAAAVFRG
jgi:hypothetical protein